MVKYSKRRREKKKAKRAVLGIPRGGFTPSIMRPTWGTVRTSVKNIVRESLKDSGLDIDKVSRTLKGAKLPTAVQVGERIAGTVYSVAQDYVSGGGKGKVPFVESNQEGTRSIGSIEVKRFKTNFHYGKPNPRVIKTLARQNGSTVMTSLDTRYSNTYKSGSTGRDYLTMNAGFNRKLIATYLNWNHSVDRLATVFSLNNFNTPNAKLQTSYACVMNLWRNIDIMNTSRYLKAKYTLKLYKPTNDSNVITNVMNSCLYRDAGLATATPLQKYMPIKYQLDGYTFPNNDASAKVWVDPKASLLDAPAFAADYEFVKSFSKWLGPGDSWNYKEVFHTGSGVNLGELKTVFDAFGVAELGHVLVLEVTGQEVAACYAPNSNENFIGKAPVYCQVEFSIGGEYVNNPHNSSSGYTSNAFGGGVVNSNYLIRSFTNHVESDDVQNKIFNVPMSNITSDPTNTANGKLFIPIMSDTSVQYAQRARQGGTGGNDN